MKKRVQKTQKGRFPGVFLSIFLALTSMVAVFSLASIALAKAMQKKEIRDSVRHFNQRRLNPLTLRIAGNRSRIYASIEHIGRRSGHVYATPVVVRPLDDGFIIPLPYGADTDWCRNVLTAGKCKLLWNGEEYTLEKPEVVSQERALGAFPIPQRAIFTVGGVKQYLLLHIYKEVPAKVTAGV